MRSMISGSELSNIITSSLDQIRTLIRSKTDPTYDITENEFVKRCVEHGLKWEEPMMELFRDMTGIEMITGFGRVTQEVNPENNQPIETGASPDGVGITPSGTPFVIEMKCPYSALYRGWQPQEPSVPFKYFIQCQANMYQLGIEKSILVVSYIPEDTIEEEKTIIQEYYLIYKMSQVFWRTILDMVQSFLFYFKKELSMEWDEDRINQILPSKVREWRTKTISAQRKWILDTFVQKTEKTGRMEKIKPIFYARIDPTQIVQRMDE